MKPNKACPIVLRRNSDAIELLAFQHPLGGCQIVKGTIDLGENLDRACSRELFEESGIEASSRQYLGTLDMGCQGQVWGFHEMVCEQTLPISWDHFTEDGGGLMFSFFWLPLPSLLDENWQDVFRKAIHFIEKVYREEP